MWQWRAIRTSKKSGKRMDRYKYEKDSANFLRPNSRMKTWRVAGVHAFEGSLKRARQPRWSWPRAGIGQSSISRFPSRVPIFCARRTEARRQGMSCSGDHAFCASGSSRIANRAFAGAIGFTTSKNEARQPLQRGTNDQECIISEINQRS